MSKTYRGGCHCGKVTYEAEINLSEGTSRCNCSYCSKSRNWGVMVKPNSFRLLSGEGDLGDYQVRQGGPNHFYFCNKCGVRTHSRGDVQEIGGAFVGICVASLVLSPEEFSNLKIKYLDGLNDNWWQAPQFTSYL